MTKRIVSGIFILTALGALGVILAGALTSGEQLIVRFLTAVIVAALGLYVISDLRLQTEQGDESKESRPRAKAESSAPPNSTAAYMATVTAGYATDPVGAGQRNNAPPRREPVRPQPTRPSVSSRTGRPGSHVPSPFAPPMPLTEPSGPTARAVRSGPPPMPPAGPTPMEPVTKAKGGLAALDSSDATATAPIPITRWTSDDGDGVGGGHSFLIGSDDAKPGVIGVQDSLNGGGNGEKESDESASVGAESVPIGSVPISLAGSSPVAGGEGDDATPAAGRESDDATYSRLGSFSYSGRLDTASTWWPAPDTGDEPKAPGPETGSNEPDILEPETGEVTKGDDHDSASAAPTGDVVDLVRRLRAVPDYQPGDGGDDDRQSSMQAATVTPAGHNSGDGAENITGDEGPAVDPTFAESPLVGLGEPIMVETAESSDVEVMDTGWPMPEPSYPTPEKRDDHLQAAEAVAGSTTGDEIRSLEAATNRLEAAAYADTPRPPMIDLRDRMAIEPEGVANAIQAGEHQVIETLIRQGMLSTSGPITDRDVRTMVYVAFTSNELRKLILAGGRPDIERADLKLGPVELFDERRFAPTPRTLYTRPEPSPAELSSAGTGTDDETPVVESELASGIEQASSALPAPSHVYRLGSESSPETVA